MLSRIEYRAYSHTHLPLPELNTPSSSRSALLPRQLTQALSSLPQTNVGSFFYAHQQQDAHELLVLITGALDDEIRAVLAERNETLRAQSLGLRAVTAPSSLAAHIAEWKHTNPFRALIAQRTACLDCGYVEAVRHYPADELSLTVPSRLGSATTIEACLAHWSKLEVVDWICFRCSLARTIARTRSEAHYLASSIESASETANGAKERPSASAKKKSGAKRRKVREARANEDLLVSLLNAGFSEDEVEEAGILQEHGIKLERTFSRTATKQVMLARTPPILVLHLNRSTYSASNFGASKNNAVVFFDEKIDLSSIVTGGDLNVSGDVSISRGATPAREDVEAAWHGGRKGMPVSAFDGLDSGSGDHSDGVPKHATSSHTPVNTRYRLCGLVVHYGGHSSGHYVAFRRREGSRKDLDDAMGVDDVLHGVPCQARDRWYRISDDSVTHCSLRDVLSQNPFLLFYERMEERDNDVSASKRLADNSAVGQNHAVVKGAKWTALSSTTRGPLASNVVHAPAVGLETAQQEERPPLLPAGFERLARSRHEQERDMYHPRIVQRWEMVHNDDASRPVPLIDGRKEEQWGEEGGRPTMANGTKDVL